MPSRRAWSLTTVTFEHVRRTLALLAILTVCVASLPGRVLGQNRDEVRVLYIVDGDTIKVSIGSKTETVRLVGIDTPETKKPGSPVECWGPEATLAMSRLVSGKTVTLTYDKTAGDRDRWGRMLRYVSVGNKDVGLALINSGAAEAYAYKNQRYSKRASYENAERRAKTSKRGMWGSC